MNGLLIYKMFELAVEKQDPSIAWPAVQEIISKKFTITDPYVKEWDKNPTKLLQFDSKCNKCQQVIKAGNKAIWFKGKGTWHTDCWKEVD